MAFHYLTFLDSGAPTLTGQNGSLTNSGNTGVLDWALVTKAGWTKSFTATNSSVFTPVTGNTVLYVAHDSAISGAAQKATVRAGESATAVGSANLTNPFPTVALNSDALSSWTVSNTADSTARPYYILITDSFIYIWLGYLYTTSNYNTTTTSSNAHIYGQFSKAFSSDSYNTVLSVNAASGVSAGSAFTNAVGSSPVGNTRLWADRTLDGSVFSPCVTLITPGGGAVGNPNTVPYPNALDSKLHLAKIAIGDGGVQSGTLSATKTIHCRGWLPNIWVPLERVGTILNSKTFVDSSYNAAALFQAFVNTNNTEFEVLETTNTWSAPSV